MQWMDISTAPKDGRDVLMGWYSGRRWLVVAAHWTESRSGHDNRVTGDGDWYVVKGGGETVPVAHRRVYWSPLPQPPANEIERLSNGLS